MKKAVLIIILFAAAILRFGYLASIWDTPIVRVPIIDSEYYHLWAARLAAGQSGGEGIFFMSPLYPYLLSFLYRLFGPFPQVGLFFQALAGILIVYLIYVLAKKIFDERIGLLSAALAACYRPLIYYEGVLLTAILILLLNAILLILLLSNPQKSYQYVVVGLLLGLSALARPGILLFAFMIIIFYLWKPPEMGRRVVLLLLIGLLAALLPVAYRNFQAGGEWVLTTASAGMNFYAGNNSDAVGIYWEAPFIRSAEPQYENQDYRSEAAYRVGHPLSITGASRYWLGQGITFITQRPFRYVRLLLLKLFLFLHATEIPNNLSIYAALDFSKLLRYIPFTFGLLAPLGMSCWLLNLRKSGFGMIQMYGLSYLLITLLFFAASEYRLPLLLVLIPFTAAGIFQLIDHFKSAKYKQVFSFLLVTVLFAFAINMSTPMTNSLASPRMDFFNLGSVMQKYHLDDEAVFMLQKALIYDPDFTEAHRALGDSYHTLKCYEQAAEEFRLAGMEPKHELNLLDAENMLSQAQFMVQSGDLSGAIEKYQQALNLHPEPPAYAYFNLAYLELQQGDTSKGLQNLNLAAELDPQEPRIPYLIGRIFENRSDYPKALERFLAALDLNINFDLARARAAAMALKLGDKAQAAKLIEPILGLQFNDPELVDIIGRVASQVGY